jgi:hypothetical protein
MVKRLTVILVFCMFVVCIFAEGAFSAVAYKKTTEDLNRVRYRSQDVYPSETFIMPSYQYPTKGVEYLGSCTPIYPDTVWQEAPLPPFVIVPIAHQQIGDTWYDFQKNGAVGRMISVTNHGYAYSAWHYTAGVYDASHPRSVRFTRELPSHAFATTDATSDPGPGFGHNSGYCNVTHLHNGSPVVIYHETAPTAGFKASMMAWAINEGSYAFNRHFDLPDSCPLFETANLMEWPKGTAQYDSVTGRDYIHIVGTEGNTAPLTYDGIGYERCYINPANNTQLICETYVNGAESTYTINNDATSQPYSRYPIGRFARSCEVAVITAVSPVSKKVAIIWVDAADTLNHDCNYFSDVVYAESPHLGDAWVTAAPPKPINITNFASNPANTERVYNDISACYDYNDSLHIIYVTVEVVLDGSGGFYPQRARLYHWSKKTGTDLISTAIWGGPDMPGSFCANIAKVSISAKDPIYHPDSTYLIATWSQFDKDDLGQSGLYTESDLYGSVSRDGGNYWGLAVNLTHTKNPGCAPGACVSEHWHSLATNLYNGDLYIQYICDRDPGGAIQPQGIWTDNPVMKVVLPEWPYVGGCRSGYIIKSPTDWTNPPLKVAPGGTRQLSLQIYNLGDRTCTGDVSGDLNCVQGSYPISLCPKCTTSAMTFTVSGAGACNGTFICGYVRITTDEAGGKIEDIPVLAVVADDYQECPGALTVDTLQNDVLWLYTNANCEEMIYDTGTAATRPDTCYQVFFEESNIIAVATATDTIVGRFVNENITTKEGFAGAQDKLYTTECDVTWEPDFWLVYTKDIYIMPPVPACEDMNTLPWYWWEKSKQIKFFKGGAGVPDAYKHIVIEYVTVKRKTAPSWWPNQISPGAYPNTYIGAVVDMDCPFDTIRLDRQENGANKAGYDDVNHIAWQRGYDWTGAHPSYNGYYCGLALANGGRPGESLVPYGAYNVKNHDYLYPNNGWGWKQGELYRLAADTLPADIQDGPAGLDSAVDRAWVFTARKIPAGNDPNASASFTLVKVVAPGSDPTTGLALMKEYVDTARAVVTREKSYGFPVICGDVTGNGVVDLGDLVYMITYGYKNGPSPPCPISRMDVTGNGVVDLGDVVYFITYGYKNGPAPTCRGFY